MVHLIQARQAFLVKGKTRVFYELADSGPGWVNLKRSIDGITDRWEVEDADRLTSILGRNDLSHRSGRPLVVGNSACRLLGFAAGPPVVPDHVHILIALDMSRLVLIAEPGQPEWWLIDAIPADSEAAA